METDKVSEEKEQVVEKNGFDTFQHDDSTIVDALLNILDDLEQSQSEISKREKLYHSILDSASNVIILLDSNNKILDCNFKSKVMFGYNSEELVGKKISLLFKNNNFSLFKSDLKKMNFHNNNLLNMDYLLPKKDGSLIHTLVNFSSTYDKQKGLISRTITIVDIDKIKKYQDELKVSLRYQKLINTILANFNSSASFDSKINYLLGKIGSFFNVSRTYIFKDFNQSKNTKNIYEWCNKGVKPQISNLQNIDYSSIPSFKKMIVTKGEINCADINDLPKDFRKILVPQKIKSILIMPIFVNKKRYGFMGFDNCKCNKRWDYLEKDLLMSITAVVSSLIEKEEANLKLFAEKKFTNRLIEDAGVPVLGYHKDGSLLIVNKEFLEVTKYSKKEIDTKEKWLNLAFPLEESLKKVSSVYDDFYKGKKINDFVFPVNCKDNKSIIIVGNITSVTDENNKIIGEVMFMRDLSEIFNLEEQIKYWVATGFSTKLKKPKVGDVYDYSATANLGEEGNYDVSLIQVTPHKGAKRKR